MYNEYDKLDKKDVRTIEIAIERLKKYQKVMIRVLMLTAQDRSLEDDSYNLRLQNVNQLLLNDINELESIKMMIESAVNMEQ